MCVTCGAWIAVQAWEHFLYSNFDNPATFSSLVHKLIPVLRGIALFFSEHMFSLPYRNDSNMHTGPTTSPENSYEIKYGGFSRFLWDCKIIYLWFIDNLQLRRINHLSLSPAIDISILRQVSQQ
jgi:hypothetical protein